MTRISVENVTYTYSEIFSPVLNNISLIFPEGKVTAILGPNGSGKTTLLNIILGILTPNSGTVLYGEENLQKINRNVLSRIVAWVPQDEEVRFPYTVINYLLMGRTPYLKTLEMPSQRDKDIIDSIINKLGISIDILDRPITRLSGGEKRLLLIARALSQEPTGLILDEPTAHLDLGNRSKVLQVIRDMSKLGKTVLFSTHDPNEALLIADLVVIMHNGFIVGEGLPEEVITEKILKSIYNIDMKVFEGDGRKIVDLHIKD